MIKIAVYTAIFNNYDELKTQPAQSIPTDFYCFTDCIDKNLFPWTIINGCQNDLHPRMKAKWYKLHPHKLFSPEKYDYSVWIDGSIQITSDLFVEAIANAIDGSGRAVFRHPVRDCIYEEATFSAPLKKYRGCPLKEQVEAYRAEGFPEHGGLYACGVIGRKTGVPIVESVDEQWWKENKQWSYQDQLSFPVVLWRNEQSTGTIPYNLWYNPIMKVMGRNRDD